MIRTAKVLAITALLLGTAAATDVLAADRVLLGERHVTDRSERDTISVGTSRGKFRSLQVKATGSAVEFKRVTVHFENGDEQVFEKNRVIRKGDKSHKIDLEGGARFIEKVVFRYEARSRGWKGAEIKLWGIR
jgi:hypothetical protein